MHTILIVGIILAGLIGLFLIIAAIGKKDYKIESRVEVHAPKQRVFDYVKMLKNQDYYSKWVMTDPNMKKEFTGTDGTVGFIYGWNGNKKAGEGDQEIMSITEGSSMVSSVRFVRPFPGKSELHFGTAELPGNSTEVTWTVSSVMKFPMNAMIPMITGMLKNDMDISLQNLKVIMEKKG